MSIAEEFEVITDAVYDKGKQEILTNSKYIEKQATGKVISLADVSEVYHKVKVSSETDTEVEVYGKNLCDISADTRFTKQEDGSYVNNTKIGTTTIPLNLPYGAYTFSYDLSCPTGVNARIKIVLQDGTIVDKYLASTGDFVHFETSITGEIVGWQFGYASQPTVETLIVKNAQIEVGTLPTLYEPCTKQTITATPEGIEISSLCPNMTFIADNDITVDYYSSFGMNENQKRFANSFQHNGAKTVYSYAFAYDSWNDYTLEQALDYDIVPYAGNNMFAHSKIKDLAGIMNRKGIVFDFIPKAPVQVFSLFLNSTVEHIPRLVMPTTSTAYGWFTSCAKLHTIDEMVCNEKTAFQSSSGDNKTFQSCTALTHCIFSGVIANDISLQWSTLLDDESLISLTRTLQDLMLAGGGFGSHTLTLSEESKNRLEQLICPADVLNPDGDPYNTIGDMTCYGVIAGAKGWSVI